MNAIDGEKEDVLKVQTVIAFIVIKSCCVYGAGFFLKKFLLIVRFEIAHWQ